MARKYVEVIKNNVALFGSLFNNIIISRTSSDKTKELDIKVPILYSGKEFFNYQIKNKLSSEASLKVKTVLPRMAFALTDLQYNNAAKGNSNVIISGVDSEGIREVQFNRVPYIFSFDLYLAANHQTDLFQMVEQILVMFKPSYNLVVKLNSDVDDDAVDVGIVIKNNKFEDFQNEIPFENITDKPIMHTISFEMKSFLYCTNEKSGLSNIPIQTVEYGVWPYDINIDDVSADKWYPNKIEE